MLANEISDIIKQVNSEKFAAIVTDTTSTSHLAPYDLPYIENIDTPEL
ncbi:6648_t:CDS:2 [Funneliformis mosseae]|uniref:6648_t:CDS:1 n=1 Tax=Funneliformis mosseae TaxID=27381 RepID=A0A9N9BBK8_FUNMO|nr:6648_t:CDS:2 [Funneliformis mosseae]